MPTQFGAYTLLEEISRGATSVVYRAKSRQGRIVALKVLARHLLDDPVARRRFMFEPKKQPRDAHIVRVLDTNVAEGVPYIAMEFIDGPSFADRIRQAKTTGGTVPLAEVDHVLGDIAKALNAAHKKGTIHRDVKPSNILIRSRDHRAFLMDFGLAQSSVAGASSGLTGVIPSGSTDYISPEQIKGGTMGPGADIYSLGITIYQALAGDLPFKSEDSIVQMHKHLNELPPALSSANPRIPQQVSKVVMRTLEKNPVLRYASAMEFAQEFHAALPGKPASAARWPIIAGLGGVVLVVVAIVGIGLLGAPKPPPNNQATQKPVISTPIRRTAVPTVVVPTDTEDDSRATEAPPTIATESAPAAATATLASFEPVTEEVTATNQTTPHQTGANQILLLPGTIGAERWGKPTSQDGCSNFDDRIPVTKYEVMITISNTGSSPLKDWRVDSYAGHGGPLAKCVIVGVEGSSVAADASQNLKFDLYVERDILTRLEFVGADVTSKLCVDALGKTLTPCN